MKKQVCSQRQMELESLCANVRAFSNRKEYGVCARLASEAMSKFPEAAEPHNLYGIALEKLGDHSGAMRHFRAAWALDPSYLPARQNMENLGTFYSTGTWAFEKGDCKEERQDGYTLEYDTCGIGHIVRRAM